MRIRKLEISGFKSFADRVALSFGNGITGVVGPNGCGKSNVVDALRWVMGEQSAKHLRGGSMTDVIFNGSQTRGPNGMAEVTVTFENDGHLVPTEYSHYSEIAVTRRLYRDGESDYEINRTPCRLRDINELFLGTGIGKQGFSIIEQGQVAVIIKSKAEDRRRLIEEAAGITKYKARRQAAERKMQATEQNLLRISDVIREVQRRLGSLKRQARKAERYKELRAEARDVELHEATLRWFELTNYLLRDRELLQAAEEALVGLEASVVALDSEAEVVRIGLMDEDKALSEAQARQYELDNKVALMEQQASHSKRSLEEGDRRDGEARQEIAGLDEALKLIESQKADLVRGTEDLMGAAEEQEETLRVAQEELAALTQRRTNEAKDLDEMRRAMIGAASRAAQLEARLNSQLERQQELQGRIDERAAELKLATEELERTRGAVGGLEEALAQAESDREEQAQRRDQLQHELDQLRQQLKSLDEDILVAKEKLGDRRSRLTSLKQIHDKFEWSPQGVRALMDEANVDPAVRGLLADLFEVPEDLEVAVTSALGERLQTVVVNSKEAAIKGIVRLLDEEQGKAWMFVEGHAAPRHVDAIAGTQKLLDYLTIPEQHREVVQSLLGNVLLVDEEQNAANLWDQAAAAGATLLTRRGSVLSPEGLLHGGSLDGEATGLLRQKREIRELEEEVAAKEAELQQLTDRRDHLASEVDRVETALEQATAKLHEIEITQMDRAQALNRHRDDVTRAERRVSDLSADVERDQKQADQIASDLEHDKHKHEEAKAEHEQRESTLNVATEAQQKLDTELREKTEAVTALKVQAAAAEERRENLRQALEHHETNEADIKGRLERLNEQVHTYAESRNQLIESEAQAKASIEELLETRRQLVETLGDSRERYNETQAKVREIEAELKQKRALLDAAKEQSSELKLALREQQLELNALTDRCLDAHSVRPEAVLHDFHLRPQPGHDAKAKLAELRRKIDALGEINLTAIEEYAELEKRYDFLKSQSDDLTHALEQLEKAILKINRTTRKRFKEAFEQINEQFEKVFPRLFRGGKAWLALTDPNDMLTTGVEIYAQPPGKKLQSVALMSGGEQALTAVSLIFAIFLIKPSPFCLLDEVDAPLDESNVSRFNELIRDVSNISQFIVITHNKRTMECADQLYGITMEQPGISKAVSVRMS